MANVSQTNASEVFLNETYITEKNRIPKIFIVDFRRYYRYGFEFALYGYFMPIWTVINIIIYSTMIFVFLKNGLTSKTHICLIALAVSDSVAPIFPSFFWFYFFTVKQEFYHVPFEWCRPFHYLTELIPRIFTHMSYFLTIMLAIQRYIVVAHPFKADRLCSKKITYIMIIMCFALSITVRLIHFFHYSYVKVTISPVEDKNTTVDVCAFGDPVWLDADVKFSRYAAILQTTHTIIVNIIPCTVLVVIEFLMLKALRIHSASRRKMNLNSSAISKMAKSERRLTYTTISITAVLLLYKIPTIIIQTLDIFRTLFGIRLVKNYFDLWTANVVLNIFYWMCTPSNFVITCCLSREFRTGLKNLFKKFVPVNRNSIKLQISGSLSSGTVSTSV